MLNRKLVPRQVKNHLFLLIFNLHASFAYELHERIKDRHLIRFNGWAFIFFVKILKISKVESILRFGMGEHVCLGAHLARLELRHAFAQLRERLVRCEPAGRVERVRSSFVGGIKRAPMRWEIRPSGAA